MNQEEHKAVAYFISEIEMNMSEDDFQRDFFESLSDQFTKRNSLSPKQIESLKKMYERVTR